MKHIIENAICPNKPSRFWSPVDEIRPSTICCQCNEMLLNHIIKQDEWMPCSEQLPPLSGYYLATWMGGIKLEQLDIGGYISKPNAVVAELWFNPDAFPNWWIPDHAHRSDQLWHNRTIQAKQVLAWRTKPEPYKP